MLKKLSLVILITASGWVSTTQAALIGVCTFSGGCGPDFAIVMTSIGYDYTEGSDTGVLSISGTVGNASFLDGQLDASWGYGNTSLNVIAATGGNDAFSMSLTLDGLGNLQSSNVTMNGKVMTFDAGIQIAPSYNGTLLDGNLITGGTISQIGWDSTHLDFIGNIDANSLLTTAGFGTGLSGLLSLDNISTDIIVWDQDWTASTNSTLDVVVPVPAALWLFVSGLIGLITVSRKNTI